MAKPPCPLLAALVTLVAGPALAPVPVVGQDAEDPPAVALLEPGVRVHLATREEGVRLILDPDYLAIESPHARALDVGVTREVTEEEHLAALRAKPADWTPEERREGIAAVAEFRRMLGHRRLPWPADLWIVKLAERPYGEAYTLGTTVFVNPEYVKVGRLLAQNLTHELFHVLSRNAPVLRERLYAAIGYRRCGPLALPPGLERMSISNPDAASLEWCTDLQLEGRTVTVFPFTYGDSFGQPGGKFRVVVAEHHKDGWTPVERDGRPWLVDPRPLPSFWERIGRNTSFVIHPEEICAENFSQILTGATRVRNPELHATLDRLLEGGPSPALEAAP